MGLSARRTPPNAADLGSHLVTGSCPAASVSATHDPLIDLGYAKVDAHRLRARRTPRCSTARGGRPREQDGAVIMRTHTHTRNVRCWRPAWTTRPRVCCGPKNPEWSSTCSAEQRSSGRCRRRWVRCWWSAPEPWTCRSPRRLPPRPECSGRRPTPSGTWGWPGLHRLLAVRDRLDDADALVVVGGHGRGATQCRGRADRRTDRCGPHIDRLRRPGDSPPCSPCSTPAPHGGQHRATVSGPGARIPDRPERAMIWWIDAGAGASGDMLLGALLGLDPDGLPAAQAAVDGVLAELGAPRDPPGEQRRGRVVGWPPRRYRCTESPPPHVARHPPCADRSPGSAHGLRGPWRTPKRTCMAARSTMCTSTRWARSMPSPTSWG